MIRPDHLQRFEQALASANPQPELQQLAIVLRDEGLSQIELYLLFERFCQLNQTKRPQPDAILDTMDLIYGGRFAKGRALYPHELDDRTINLHRRAAWVS